MHTACASFPLYHIYFGNNNEIRKLYSVGTSTSDKLMDLPHAGNPDIQKCKKSHKNTKSDSDVLVRRKAGSYLMAAKGLMKQVNKQMNKVDSLYSINLK